MTARAMSGRSWTSGLELSIPDVQSPDVAFGNEGGDVRRSRDHGHLADDLSCAPSCDRLAVPTDDADGAVEQDVHLLAQLALGTDDVAVRVGVLLGDLGDTLQVGGPFTYGAAVGAGDDFVG